jgi:hypothetical protein
MAQFDQAAGELGLDWTSARVIRVWERWRLAQEVFKGERGARSFIGRDFHAPDRSRKNQEEPIRGVRRWLRSRPQRESGSAYDEFAKAHNASQASADNQLRFSRSVGGALRLRWPNVVAVARGEISLTAARERELAELLPRASSANAILGLPGASRLLKRSGGAVVRASNENRHFPTPVAVIDGNRAWLYGDLKRYQRGLMAPKRSEGELQYLYMDATELSTRLKLSPKAFRRRIREKRWDLVPRPEGAVAAGTPYWLREKVEDWLRVKGKAELTPEQEDEIRIANARQAIVLAASLKAAQRPGRRRRRRKA